MKLGETILLSFTICLMVVGIHQSFTHGFANSYFIFMLMISTLALYQMQKNKRIEKEHAFKKDEGEIAENKIKVSKRKRRR